MSGKDCAWVLVDLNYFYELRDAKAIRDYCRCDDNKNKPKRGGAVKKNEDLLDFEF
jgi:hypothetical protein